MKRKANAVISAIGTHGKRTVIIASVAIALFLTSTVAFAQTATLRVDGDNGSPTPPDFGHAWGADAYKYLEDALADATLLTGPGGGFEDAEIWVAEIRRPSPTPAMTTAITSSALPTASMTPP